MSSRRSSRSPTSWSRAVATSASSSRSSCWCAGSRRWPTTASRRGPCRPAPPGALGLAQIAEPHPAQHLRDFVNWTPRTRRSRPSLPHGSMKRRLPCGSMPASSSAARTASRSSTTSPKWRSPSGPAPALREREELVAHVEERHPGHPPAQLEAEQPPVELERGVEIADLERHVVDADQARFRHARIVRPSAPVGAPGDRPMPIGHVRTRQPVRRLNPMHLATSAARCSRSASPSSSCPPPSPTVISSRRSRRRWSTTHADPGGGQ